MKKVVGYFARNECLLPRNMGWCERQEFICGRCHWSELYHQVIDIVPTEVHFRSTERDFLIFFFFCNYRIKHLHTKKSDVSIKLHRTRFSPYTLSFSCIVHIIACLVWKGRNCTTLPYLTLILLTWIIRWTLNNASRWQIGLNSAFKELTRILFSHLSWGYILRLLKRLFCFRTRREDEHSAFKSSE